MSVHACILGATGYGGGELLRLLSAHPDLGRIDGVSRSRAGQPFHAAHPNLRGISDGVFTSAPDWHALASAERPVLFAALPHGELARRWPGAWADIEAAGLSDRIVVIDLSADFRLQDAAAYGKHYDREHPCPDWLGQFRYGLPELWADTHVGAALSRRESVGATPSRRDDRGAKAPLPQLIANPGCFATAVQLALLPLAKLPDPGLIAVTGVTGSSGSGATPGDTAHHPTRAHDFRAYKLDGHPHLAEVEQMFALAGGGPRHVVFVPHSAPLVRGIFVTAQFVRPAGVGDEQLVAAYADTYARTPFVRLVDGSPRIVAVAGSNFCDVGVAVRGSGIVAMAALDNLVKGMAGQAVQNMNLALGLDETAGLMQAALYPG